MDTKPRNEGSQELFSEISKKSGVPEEDVRKVLGVLGIEKNLDEASKLIGKRPGLAHLLVGFRISPGTVTV
jgi:hypothetical protein